MTTFEQSQSKFSRLDAKRYLEEEFRKWFWKSSQPGDELTKRISSDEEINRRNNDYQEITNEWIIKE